MSKKFGPVQNKNNLWRVQNSFSMYMKKEKEKSSDEFSNTAILLQSTKAGEGGRLVPAQGSVN